MSLTEGEKLEAEFVREHSYLSKVDIISDKQFTIKVDGEIYAVKIDSFSVEEKYK